MSQPKWRRRAQARPDEILNVALQAFQEKGFDAARIEDIAKAAGLSKAAVYLYFASKEQVLRALIEREIAPVVAAMEAAAEALGHDPRQALSTLTEFVASRLNDPNTAAVPQIVISIAGRFPELSRYYYETVIARGEAMLTRLIQRGVELGQFRQVDPKAFIRAAMGGLLFQLLRRRIAGQTAPLDVADFVASHVDFLLRGLEKRGEA